MGKMKFIDGDILEVDPSVRVYHIFVNNGIKKVKDLLIFIDNDEKIKQLDGVGEKSFKQIKEIVQMVKTRQNEPLFKETQEVKSMLDFDISKIGLKFMICHHLKKGDINTVRDLMTTDEEYLKSLRQIGKISFKEIQSKKEEILKILSKEEIKELEEIKLNNSMNITI